MASLRERENGTKEILFRDEYGRRKTISLGKKYKRRFADELKKAVEVLIDKKINKDPRQHSPTKAWVENAPPEVRKKLANVGLWELPSTHTVKELWDTFFDEQFDADACEGTRNTYLYAKERFFRFFKPTEMLDELTQDRMKEWKAFLQTEYRSLRTNKQLSSATVAGTITKAKAVFNWAKRERWITARAYQKLLWTRNRYYCIIGFKKFSWRIFYAKSLFS